MNPSPLPRAAAAGQIILVIEDQDVLRRNLALLLEMDGYRVVTAENGRRGIEEARRLRPGLILCDVMMPEADGHEVARALRADPAFDSVPLVFLSAKGGEDDLSAARDLQCDGYLTKPVVREDLLSMVAERLSRGRDGGPAPVAASADQSADPAQGSLRESLSVLLTGTDILRHHGGSLSESERQAQRESMRQAGARLAAALEAGNQQ